MTEKLEAICQDWEESERGWGTRPDGCSLHLTIEDRNLFVKNYWDLMPREVPDEYERPEGNPFRIEVSRKLYNQIKKSDEGLRLYQHNVRELIKSNDLLRRQGQNGLYVYSG